MAEAQIPISWASAPAELAAALALREQVFCEEQGVPHSEEVDARDLDALHLVARQPQGDRVIGTLRLMLEGREAKVGRVAVDRDWRHRGIASRMLELALAQAAERGAQNVRLAAQVEAVALYERAGFAVQSDPFQDAGIAHVWMGRRLCG